MKWLTISEIKRRSKTAKSALKVSYEHWNQLYTATAKELREAYEKEKVFADDRDCGLCIYYSIRYGRGEKDRCAYCPLPPCGAGSLYDIATRELDKWYDGDGDWHAWKRACKALRDKLKELIEQESKRQ